MRTCSQQCVRRIHRGCVNTHTDLTGPGVRIR